MIGYEYVFIVSHFLFVCFFVSLVPIIPLFAVIGYLALYWAQKYCVLNRYKRPSQGNTDINGQM